MSIGHGSGVIERSWLDSLIAHIEQQTTFNTAFNIPLAGGSSQDGKTIYMDQAIPPSYTQKDGKAVDVTRYLRVHEFVEKRLIDAKIPYLPAHAVATAAETAAVEDDGFDMGQYDAFWNKWEKVAAKHKLGDSTPPYLETAPYKDGGK